MNQDLLQLTIETNMNCVEVLKILVDRKVAGSLNFFVDGTQFFYVFILITTLFTLFTLTIIYSA
jgi:hypothetical protein